MESGEDLSGLPESIREELLRLRAEWPEVIKDLPPPVITWEGLLDAFLLTASTPQEALFITGATVAISTNAHLKTKAMLLREIFSLASTVKQLFETAPQPPRESGVQRPNLRLVPKVENSSQGGPDLEHPRRYPKPPGATRCPPPTALSPRQKQCLMLLKEGLSSKEAAARLQLSHHTVAQHLLDAYRRLGVSSGRHAVARAEELALI